MCLSFDRHIQLYLSLPEFLRDWGDFPALHKLKTLHHVRDAVLRGSVERYGMGGLVGVPRAEELVVGVFVSLCLLLYLLVLRCVDWRVRLQLVSIKHLLVLFLVLALDCVEALPRLVVHLVSAGEDEGVSLSYALNAIVVEVALVVPLRLVNEIMRLVSKVLLEVWY